MLEDETTSTANDMMVLFHEKILPNLSNNIKCGNSLIGTDILTQKLDLDLQEERKLNPFDFKTAFPKVFGSASSTTRGLNPLSTRGLNPLSTRGLNPLSVKGFDAIVGNPPYVKEYTEREIFENIKKGQLVKYYQGKMDLWYFFVCYGLELIKENGYINYIVPNNWVSNAGASILRNTVIKKSKIIELIDFGAYMVFNEASIQTMIMNIQKNETDNEYSFLLQHFNECKVTENKVNEELKNKLNFISTTKTFAIKRENYVNKFLKFEDGIENEILIKIFKAKNFELDKNEATNGIHPHHSYINKKMLPLLENKYSVGTGVFALNKSELENLNLNEKEKMLIKPFYSDSKLINKFYCNPKNIEWIIYTDSSFKNISKIEEYPNIKKHLDKFKDIITSDNKPYGLHRAREEKFFINEKIIVQRMCSEPSFSYDNNFSYFSAAFYLIKSQRINLKYLTAIFNSKLVKFWLKRKGKMQGNIFQIDKEPLLQIPIHHTSNEATHDQIVTLVEQILRTKSQLQTAHTDRDKTYLEQKCEGLEAQINTLVYALYDLSDAEIQIVENEK